MKHWYSTGSVVLFTLSLMIMISTIVFITQQHDTQFWTVMEKLLITLLNMGNGLC